MSTPATLDPQIRAAAERAVQEDGALAVILFGSHARGDATPESDVDLVVVGDTLPAGAAHALHTRLSRHHAVDVLARSLRSLREETHDGTVWGNIVREGTVVAGSIGDLAEMDVKPPQGALIGRSLGRLTAACANNCLSDLLILLSADMQLKAALARGDWTVDDEWYERGRAAAENAAKHSTATAEHVVAGIAQLAGAAVTGSHNMHQASTILNERANEITQAAVAGPAGKASRERAGQIRALAATALTLNEKSRDNHIVGYTAVTPFPVRTLTRLERAATLQGEALRALIRGDGPLHWLTAAACERFEGHGDPGRERADLTEQAAIAAKMIADHGRTGLETLAALPSTPTASHVERVRALCRQWTDTGTALAQEADRTHPRNTAARGPAALRALALRLLTVDLGENRPGPRPLDGPEWHRLDRHLRAIGQSPQMLATPAGQEALARWNDQDVTPERVKGLLMGRFTTSITLEAWERAGIWTVTIEEPEYPQALLNALGPIAPPVLYGSGEKALLNAEQGTPEPTVQSSADENGQRALREALDAGRQAIEILGSKSLRNAVLSRTRRARLASAQLAVVTTVCPDGSRYPTRDAGGTPLADKLAKAWRNLSTTLRQ